MRPSSGCIQRSVATDPEVRLPGMNQQLRASHVAIHRRQDVPFTAADPRGFPLWRNLG